MRSADDGRQLEWLDPDASRGQALIYKVKLLKTDEGYAVWCPALPGCTSQGTTEDEAMSNIREGDLCEYLAALGGKS